LGRRKKQARRTVNKASAGQRERLIIRLRRAYPAAERVEVGPAPHGYRVLVISREFLQLCPAEREADLAHRLGNLGRNDIALTFLATPDEEWSGDWPFINRRRFLDPKTTWRGVE
jgi:hypothetical protein